MMVAVACESESFVQFLDGKQVAGASSLARQVLDFFTGPAHWPHRLISISGAPKFWLFHGASVLAPDFALIFRGQHTGPTD